MKNSIALIGMLLFFASCDKSKKIVVISKGEADINTEAKTIKAKDGGGYDEKTVTVSGDKLSFQLQSPAGEGTAVMTENGFYLVNVTLDTLLGSYQKYSTPEEAQTKISQEVLKQKIDSLKQMVEGKNISAANRNYFVLPNNNVKMTDNLQSIFVGPYHQMTSAEMVDGKVPEVYRFYSIKEVREMIARLEALTVVAE